MEYHQITIAVDFLMAQHKGIFKKKKYYYNIAPNLVSVVSKIKCSFDTGPIVSLKKWHSLSLGKLFGSFFFALR